MFGPEIERIDMWRLWKALKWFNSGLVLAVILSLFASGLVDENVRDKIFDFIIDPKISPLLIITFLIDVLLCSVSGISYAKKRNREREEKLLSEFEFLVTSEELTPEHMRFESLMFGQQPSPGKRPHYPHYMQQVFIPGEKRSEHHSSSEELSEVDLSDLINNKTDFVLLGGPTAGKSRALYSVLKSTPGIMVMKPRTDHLPSNDALRLCKDELTVILLDDLNEFASGSLDVSTLLARLNQLAIECTLVCACRDGTELSVVKEAVSSPIRRLYQQIPIKLTLKAPVPEDKRELFQAVFPGKDISEEELRSFPTFGSIVMDDALKFMKDRFERLSNEQQDCLSSMQMLIRGGVLPLTAERVTVILQLVFKRNTENLMDYIQELNNQGFLLSGVKIPIIPEMAYLRDYGPLRVVTNSLGLNAKEQLYELVGALKTINDAEGIFYVAVSLSQLGHSEDAIKVYDDLVSRFGDASETDLRKQVAMALFNKGAILGQLDRSEDAIVVYDEVVRRFGEASETDLMEPVARSLFNKGVALGKLDRIEDAIVAYDEVVSRFGDATETELRESVARALVNKGVALGRLDRSEDEIEVYDEVVRRFRDASETDLREQVVKALIYKGLTLDKMERGEDACAALCIAWGYRSDLNEDTISVIEKAFEIIGRSPDECT